MKIQGNCLCGDISYQVEGRTSAGWYCHCSKCRRSSGSAFNSAVACRASGFRWLGGEDLIREYSDGPDGYRTKFCPRCGSTVPHVAEAQDFVWIPAGTLDDADLHFASHIHVSSKASWFEIADDLTQYEQGPNANRV